MPRETEKHSLINLMIGEKQIGGPRPGGKNQDGHGMTKSEDFFFLDSGFRSHVAATTVCATEVHTLRVARTPFWHSFIVWRTDIAHAHGSRCLQCARHISPSQRLHSHVSSAVLAFPARSLRDHVPVYTIFDELYPARKRGSYALPHERRGVWLPGRSHALHTLLAPSSHTHANTHTPTEEKNTKKKKQTNT